MTLFKRDDAPTVRYLGCECKPGYINIGTEKICHKCHNKCFKCVTDVNTCDGCTDTTTRDPA